jgi:hypothetical protein
MTSSSRTVLAVFCVAVMGVSCTSEKAAPPAAQAPAAAATAAVPAAPASTTSLAVAEGDFGVPECDQFMKKYLECIDGKVPEMARVPLKQALDQQKAAWKQAASTPQGKAALATGCLKAEATAKQSTAAYGCQW